MGNIMNNWQGIKNGMNLSQKFLDKIKPEYALKNKINGAEKQMILTVLMKSFGGLTDRRANSLWS